jgi:hypothetical protein
MRAAAAVLAASAALAVGTVWLAQSDTVFCLDVLSETASTITFAWTPPQGADGYRFVRDGKVVSHTWDGTRSSVRFSKGKVYRVDVLDASVSDGYPDAP